MIWEDVLKPLLIAILFFVLFFYIFRNVISFFKNNENLEIDNVFLQEETEYDFENFVNEDISKASLFFLEIIEAAKDAKKTKFRYKDDIKNSNKLLLVDVILFFIVILLVVIVILSLFKVHKNEWWWNIN